MFWNQLWFQIGRNALNRTRDSSVSSEGCAGRIIAITRFFTPGGLV